MRRDARAPTQRQLRVGEELRHALAWILERGEVHDPGLAGQAITVTEVRVSPDLKNATAFVMPLGGGEAETIVDVLTRAKGFLRHRVAKDVNLRYAPRISFKADPSFDEAGRIEAILHDPLVARDLEKGEPGDDGNGA
ncbi:MAG TPA: 30S ribosome-binding factor RbfA [Rhodospirillales bacterium]|nr:30S ribosome-binding factor RbfA [Rhodospirillales bacterium]